MCVCMLWSWATLSAMQIVMQNRVIFLVFIFLTSLFHIFTFSVRFQSRYVRRTLHVIVYVGLIAWMEILLNIYMQFRCVKLSSVFSCWKTMSRRLLMFRHFSRQFIWGLQSLLMALTRILWTRWSCSSAFFIRFLHLIYAANAAIEFCTNKLHCIHTIPSVLTPTYWWELHLVLGSNERIGAIEIRCEREWAQDFRCTKTQTYSVHP